jgi:hypothetical protein
MRILFCVPAYGSQVRVETMLTVASSVQHMSQTVPGIEIRLFAIDMAEISRVRNLFASMAMEQGYDVLMMLDSDMWVPPETYTRLLMSGHEVCGATYAKREIDLERFHAMAKSGLDLQTCTTGALNFLCSNAFVHENGTFAVRESFVEMHELPGGCLCIRTSALKRLWKEMPDIRQTKNIGDVEAKMDLKRLIRCFDNIQTGDQKFSEDISFFRRWTKIGGKAYVLYDVPVAHFGHMKFEGKFSDHIMARAISVQPLNP